MPDKTASPRRLRAINVLHVIPAVAPRYGGPSEAVIRTCRALDDAGVETSIVATDADGPGRLSVARGELVDYRGVPARFFPRQFSEAFKYSRPLARWLAEHVREFDVIHIHAVFSHSSLAAAAAARRAGLPYIVRPLGSLSTWALRQRRPLKWVLWRAGVKRMLRSAAAIHCTSESEQEHVEAAVGRCSGAVVPLGVDLPLQISAHAADRAPYILVLGRLHPVKGLDLLLPAFLNVVQERFPDWRLVLAGDGHAAYIAGLKQRFRSHPAWNRVEFTGWVSGETKTELLRSASLLAMPSYQENFGLSAFEALACGVPVLVSSCIDVAAEIDEEQAGWVTDLSVADLKLGLIDAMNDANERAGRGARGRALVASRYTWPAAGDRLVALYERVKVKSESGE